MDRGDERRRDSDPALRDAYDHRSRGRSRKKPVGGTWVRFQHDLRDVRERYGKRTSTPHKRFVWALVAAGALLRLWLLWQPITAGEARSFMAFATHGVVDAISDYSLPGNHVLHTLLTKWSTGLFGTNVMALRLPAFLASVLSLPLLYLFVRSLFNRYIALMALAMAAGLPALAETGSLAYGYSLSWAFILLAMLLGRHFARENNMLSAVLIGVSCAFAMWSVPTAVFAVITVHLWVLFTLLGKYDRSLGERLGLLGLSLLIFVAGTILLYLPVVLEHGLDQLFRHASEGERNWKAFSSGYADKVLDLWTWISDPGYWWVSLLGFIGVMQAAYISAKYRMLLISTALGAIPLSLALADAGDPWQWAYSVHIFIIGGAIGLFYLLKLVQDKVLPRLGKRTRTGWASVVLVLGFALPGASVVRDRVGHLPEAQSCVNELVRGMHPEDRLCLDLFWEAPVGFELRGEGRNVHALEGRPGAGGLLFVVLDQPRGAAIDVVMLRCDQHREAYDPPTMVKDWPRMGIFAARLR